MENVYLEDNYMTSDALQLYPDAGGGGYVVVYLQS